MSDDLQLKNFVELSGILTGYSATHLMPVIDPIGIAKVYWEFLQTQTEVSQDLINQLLKIFEDIKAQPGIKYEEKVKAVKEKILDDSALLPVARRIIRLWYLSTWYTSEPPKELGQVVSMNAYIKGLAWEAIQAHPMGYSELTFGYWAEKPKQTTD
ncbi:hypothetical protein NUACC21_45840 [Scytonema sp. NUACC21]